jgi:hypothetical protein
MFFDELLKPASSKLRPRVFLWDQTIQLRKSYRVFGWTTSPNPVYRTFSHNYTRAFWIDTMLNKIDRGEFNTILPYA